MRDGRGEKPNSRFHGTRTDTNQKCVATAGNAFASRAMHCLAAQNQRPATLQSGRAVVQVKLDNYWIGKDNFAPCMAN
jgi:hypothetical protein